LVNNAFPELSRQLMNMPKHQRVVAEGNAQIDNPDVTAAINYGLTYMLSSFCRENNIDSSQVLAVRRDSITYIGDRARVVDIEHAHWRHVDTMCVYHRFAQNIEIGLTLEGRQIVKGLGMPAQTRHRNYTLQRLTEYMKLELGGSRMLEYLSNWRREYLQRRLPIGFYREFTVDSLYRLLRRAGRYTIYTDAVTVDPVFIDDSYNYVHVLHELFSCQRL
jgi:hypothetical protein